MISFMLYNILEMKDNNTDNIIEIKDLVFDYKMEQSPEGEQQEPLLADLRAVDHLSLNIPRGSFTAVIGRNGSGKSTLAKNINSLLQPTEGCVFVDGYDTRDKDSIWEIRRRVGMVFQNPDNQLVSAVVEDDVAFGPENLGVEPDEIRRRIRIALDSTGMYDQRKMAPHLLSGGQKQRVAIAGVLAMKPDVIIFDEPTAMLDPEGRTEVMDIIGRLNESGTTVILITHFMSEAVRADRIVIMDEGKIALDGSPESVFSHNTEIESLGLKLPFAVKIAGNLRESGVDIPGSEITDEKLAEYLAKIIKSGGTAEADKT